tara:strand:- start:249 stop:620 length:372 start_codon:yes stop_codon:yes gene_type:complete
LVALFSRNLFADGITAVELYKSCKNYYDWVSSKFDLPVDEKMLFDMGKCQGAVIATGKIMLTVCKEKKMNVNISKQLAANLTGIKSFDIIEYLVDESIKANNLHKTDGQFFLMQIIEKKWPCL